MLTQNSRSYDGFFAILSEVDMENTMTRRRYSEEKRSFFNLGLCYESPAKAVRYFCTPKKAEIFASLGVGVGLAINGTLSNFAGGMMILITRPFKDDDYIEACGYSGTVEDIRICHTRLRTTDNKVVYLPNGKLSTAEVVNYSEKDLRRVDLTF